MTDERAEPVATEQAAPPARVVYKYPLDLTARAQVLSMPHGARIVHINEQNECPTMWAEVNTSAPAVERTFCVFATGEPIAVAFRRYVGTVHIGWTVWHIYESEAV